jgi:hypothetical protein
MLTRFLNKLLEGKYNNQIDLLKNHRKATGRYPYGLDEVFIDLYVYKYIKEHNSRVLLSVDYGAFNYLINALKTITPQDLKVLKYYYSTDSVNLFRQVKQILKNHLDELIAYKPCFSIIKEKMSFFKNSFKLTNIFNGSEL